MMVVEQQEPGGSSQVQLQETRRQIFHTPLSTQRYCFVQKFIESNESIKTVTDVGCGNGRILNWLKTVASLKQINCIDASHVILEGQLDNYFRPNLCEMLFGRKNTSEDLRINVFHGDVAVPDNRLMADLFTMVEMIEHISLEHLAEVSRNVFGYYQPKFVLVTTPNIEFNPILNQISSGQTVDNILASPVKGARRFRHLDHKFEFNQVEFRQWAQSICDKYSYEVHFDGVGRMPEVPASIGPCTQIAIFRRVSETRGGDADFDCLDLLVRKLSVEKGIPECCERDARKVSLRTTFVVPGATKYQSRDEPPPLWEPIPDVDIQIETN